MNTVKTIGIVGYGSMGKICEDIFQKAARRREIKIFSRSDAVDQKRFFSLKYVCESDVVIVAVPIHAFEETVKEIVPFIRKGALVMDVCSVKKFPKKILLKHLPKAVGIMTTHPMFGPATLAQQKGEYRGLKIVVEEVRDTEDLIPEILQVFLNQNITIIEMESDEHDRLAAEFHFVSHVLSTLLKQSDFKKTLIDTASVGHIHAFLSMINEDSRELLKDMYDFNPYCKKALKQLHVNMDAITNMLTEK